MANNYKRHHLDVLVCLGGGGTQKSAYRLKEKGLNIITLPKTIDNDVAMTDVTFGFDTALTHQLYQAVEARGGRNEGNHSLVKALEALAGIEVQKKQ